MWDGDYGPQAVIKSKRSNNASITDLLNEQIPVLGGIKTVPLREIATVENKMEYGQIVHRNGLRTISVIAEVDQNKNVEAYRTNNEYGEWYEIAAEGAGELRRTV